MKTLVFGGTGYLGSKVVKELLKQNKSVCVFKRTHDYGFLADVKNEVEFITGDIHCVEEYLCDNQIDWILNFVGVYEKSGTDIAIIVQGNIMFELQLLNLAVKYNVTNFLTIDTGLPKNFNLYSFTKDKFNEFGKYYSHRYHINFYDIKLEMFYGKDEPNNRFLPLCVEKMKTNQTLELTEGTQQRDIMHIEDVVAAILAIMRSELKNYNEISVGSGESHSIREIIEYMHEISNSKSELRYGVIPMRHEEPNTKADLTILNSIGFQPKYDWKSGLKTLFE